MAIITGLRRELSTITILLVVCSIFITGVKAQNGTTTIAAKTATAAPHHITATTSIEPASASTTAATSSTVPKSSTVPTSSTQTTTTPTPTHSTSHTAEPSGRKFDAASFIGGIILGIVSVVLLSIGYKWYQNRRKSYHSL